jgi:hypothetical protein
MLFSKAFLTVCLLFAPISSQALETDQFTTPPLPLADIGSALDQQILAVLYRFIQREDVQVEETPAQYLYRKLGRGLPQATLETWAASLSIEDLGLKSNAGVLVKFKPASQSKSIYKEVFSPVPFALSFLAATEKIYGHYVGTDKIGHFMQQGFEYFTIYEQVLRQRQSEAAAVEAAVANGIRQEATFFGSWLTGVYSNGDLAANFSGFKFYVNLTRPVQIGRQMLPALLIKQSGKWQFSRERKFTDPSAIRAFISDHLDESLNPSSYFFTRNKIREAIALRCETWSAFYGERAKKALKDGSKSFETYFGESYGHQLDSTTELSAKTICAK